MNDDMKQLQSMMSQLIEMVGKNNKRQAKFEQRIEAKIDSIENKFDVLRDDILTNRQDFAYALRKIGKLEDEIAELKYKFRS